MIDFNKIKELRKIYLKINQIDFAKEIGVSIATYQRFERGESELSGEAILNIMDIYGVRRQWLRNGVEPIFEEIISEEPPVGYTVIKTEDIVSMQKRMIELQDKVIERQEIQILRGAASEK